MPADPKHPLRDAREREAKESLQALREQSTLLGSSLADAGRRTARHFAGEDPNDSPGSIDPVELWGRRIGRALSLAAFLGLAAYLYLTYVR